jgi:hypothetical protein
MVLSMFHTLKEIRHLLAASFQCAMAPAQRPAKIKELIMSFSKPLNMLAREKNQWA